jgi:hypothetical protein
MTRLAEQIAVFVTLHSADLSWPDVAVLHAMVLATLRRWPANAETTLSAQPASRDPILAIAVDSPEPASRAS